MNADDIDTVALRAKAIEVLDWAATVYRPGSDWHSSLTGLSARLRDPGVRLRPTDGSADGALRSALRRSAQAADELAAIVSDLPDGLVPDTLPSLARTMGPAARAALLRLSAEVSFGDIETALSGTWSDGDLSMAIQDLRRDMALALSQAPAAPSP